MSTLFQSSSTPGRWCMTFSLLSCRTSIRWGLVSFPILINLSYSQTAVLYGSAPNPKLHDPKTGDQLPMLSIAASTVPLVINFGSCTWPPFMANLAKIKKIQAKFGSRATFLTIYTQGKSSIFPVSSNLTFVSRGSPYRGWGLYWLLSPNQGA